METVEDLCEDPTHAHAMEGVVPLTSSHGPSCRDASVQAGKKPCNK